MFKYSQRKGTKAAVMSGQIDGKKKEERSQKLIELSNKYEKEYNETYVGKEVEVLWEEEKEGFYRGHTKNYMLAFGKIKGSEENKKTEGRKIENTVTKAKCVEAKQDHIIVEM